MVKHRVLEGGFGNGELTICIFPIFYKEVKLTDLLKCFLWVKRVIYLISTPHYPASTFPHTRVLGEAEEDGKAPHIWAYKPSAAFPKREFPNWNQQTLVSVGNSRHYVGIKRLSVSAEGLANR